MVLSDVVIIISKILHLDTEQSFASLTHTTMGSLMIKFSIRELPNIGKGI
ncbi:hypothetical protein ACFSTE_13010 [Aquimarina hainanensis]|uniref:Uncharacterized protein n=1 Tax=Aquimarina hainanensis TaxID=1578017 RepID=A0ABW5N876_9FLAO|nr:hypothetical protein [Aquimarina sp. TRL1]